MSKKREEGSAVSAVLQMEKGPSLDFSKVWRQNLIFSISKCVHFNIFCLILAMLYSYAFLILTVLIFFFFFTIKERGFYSFSSEWFLKYSRASPFSAQIFRFCIGMWGFFPKFYCNCSTVHIQQRERSREGQIYIHWLDVLTFQYKITGLLYCIKVRVSAWKGYFIDTELKT